jgi:hypothetical protein
VPPNLDLLLGNDLKLESVVKWEALWMHMLLYDPIKRRRWNVNTGKNLQIEILVKWNL